MIDRLVQKVRRVVERALPWYDPADRNRRALRTEVLHHRAIHARIDWENRLAAYRRIHLPR